MKWTLLAQFSCRLGRRQLAYHTAAIDFLSMFFPSDCNETEFDIEGYGNTIGFAKIDEQSRTACRLHEHNLDCSDRLLVLAFYDEQRVQEDEGWTGCQNRLLAASSVSKSVHSTTEGDYIVE